MTDRNASKAEQMASLVDYLAESISVAPRNRLFSQAVGALVDLLENDAPSPHPRKLIYEFVGDRLTRFLVRGVGELPLYGTEFDQDGSPTMLDREQVERDDIKAINAVGTVFRSCFQRDDDPNNAKDRSIINAIAYATEFLRLLPELERSVEFKLEAAGGRIVGIETRDTATGDLLISTLVRKDGTAATLDEDEELPE
jgi:hypothetical protein